jgi:hypothetical protein
MRITGITVCVDYARYLDQGIFRWKKGLEKLLVITAPNDAETLALCAQSWKVDSFATDIFYRNGAHFNRGAALSQAIKERAIRETSEWILCFDGDVVPPEDWYFQLTRLYLPPGCIFGAHRRNDDGVLLTDQTSVVGYFMLFQRNDPHLPPIDQPLFDVFWSHAGNSDDTLAARWPRDRQIRLPLVLDHKGSIGTNWCGINKQDVMNKAIADASLRGIDWRTEKLKAPPSI